jgi:hypothetical protein
VSLSSNSTSLIWGNYLDLDQDVKPYLQMPAYDTVRDYTLQLSTDSACQQVQKMLGRPIAPTTFDMRFDGWSGWNGANIELPFYPVLEVITVNEYWGVAGPHLLLEQTPTNQVDGFQIDYKTGRLIRVFPGLVQKPWFPGSRNIEVQWTAGYNPIPADIKEATLELIAWKWRNTQQAMRSNGPSPIGAEYDTSNMANGLWPGIPHRLQEVFDSYMQVGMG